MYSRILIAYDAKPESMPVLHSGVALASALGARVILVGVIATDTRVLIAEAMAPMGLPDRFAEEFRDALESEAEAIREKGLEVEVHCAHGEPAEAICHAARATEADLMVIGHHERVGLQHYFDLSTGHSVIDHMPCNLLVVGIKED
ncbi:MAG TPA: universal stress protein [Dongiaceae bacterium]|nr:universal stress protein [Dongiaceae bacterium]